MSSDGVALLLTAAAASAILYLARRRRLQPPKKAQPIAPDTSKIKLQTTPDELLSICRLRYMVYVGELKRSDYSYVDNIKEILEDPLDHVEGCVNLFIQHPEERDGGGRCNGGHDLQSKRVSEIHGCSRSCDSRSVTKPT